MFAKRAGIPFTAWQLILIVLLEQNEPVYTTKAFFLAGINSQPGGKAVTYLLNAGLIKREQHYYQKLLRLTPTGRRVAEYLKKARDEMGPEAKGA